MLGLTYVKAGANGISPSDMNDGRVAHLRATLDAAGFDIAPIMSYSTKFASNFYGPFRDAADSAPQFGDRRSYQLDVRNRSDALASSRRCAEEGADLLMVKPGQPSADLIRPIAEQTGLPVGAYQVSGEYTSLVLLAREKFVDFDAALLESWYNLRRAGASYIITYGARLAQRPGAATLMRYFPLFLDIKDKPVLLVGGGEVAARKFHLLSRRRARRSPSSRPGWVTSSPPRWRAARSRITRASSPPATSTAPGSSSPPRTIAP